MIRKNRLCWFDEKKQLVIWGSMMIVLQKILLTWFLTLGNFVCFQDQWPAKEFKKLKETCRIEGQLVDREQFSKILLDSKKGKTDITESIVKNSKSLVTDKNFAETDIVIGLYKKHIDENWSIPPTKLREKCVKNLRLFKNQLETIKKLLKDEKNVFSFFKPQDLGAVYKKEIEIYPLAAVVRFLEIEAIEKALSDDHKGAIECWETIRRVNTNLNRFPVPAFLRIWISTNRTLAKSVTFCLQHSRFSQQQLDRIKKLFLVAKTPKRFIRQLEVSRFLLDQAATDHEFQKKIIQDPVNQNRILVGDKTNIKKKSNKKFSIKLSDRYATFLFFTAQIREMKKKWQNHKDVSELAHRSWLRVFDRHQANQALAAFLGLAPKEEPFPLRRYAFFHSPWYSTACICEVENRICLAVIATYEFYLRHGKYPSCESFDALKIRDPFDPKNLLQFRIKDRSAVIWSVGIDGKNNNGRLKKDPEDTLQLSSEEIDQGYKFDFSKHSNR